MWRRPGYWIALIILSALATCPAAVRRFRAQRRAEEPLLLLSYLGDQIDKRWAATGRLPTGAAMTPPVGTCCGADDGVCEAAKARWAAAGWKELAFSIDDPHRFSYEVITDQPAKAVVVRAVGDTDCDGKLATVELRMEMGMGSGKVGVRLVKRENPGE